MPARSFRSCWTARSTCSCTSRSTSAGRTAASTTAPWASTSMPRLALGLACAALLAGAARAETADERAAGAVLDAFHAAAARADAKAYFDLFTPDGVFIGTDAGERWTVPQFKAYAAPVFARGKGW